MTSERENEVRENFKNRNIKSIETYDSLGTLKGGHAYFIQSEQELDAVVDYENLLFKKQNEFLDMAHEGEWNTFYGNWNSLDYWREFGKDWYMFFWEEDEDFDGTFSGGEFYIYSLGSYEEEWKRFVNKFKVGVYRVIV